MSASTIYALSSGHPPAAIAVIRISGPAAWVAAAALAGALPPPRRASLRTIRHPTTGETLDRGLLLLFPGPDSATGEPIAELHLHGGRSVIAAVTEALATFEELRPAEPGEFTRRSFQNGCIDLAEAEGLADLLAAETQSQRRVALALAGGALSRRVDDWQQVLLGLAAEVEAMLDFADEGEVEDELSPRWRRSLSDLTEDIEALLGTPPAERLRDGIRIVIAGPPNAGKSTLLNRLAGRRAAITSAVAGTTRDVIEAPTAIGGTPFLLVDTAGLRDSDDEVEARGVALALEHLAAADLILWLGERADIPFPERAIVIAAKADLYQTGHRSDADLQVSAETGEGMAELARTLLEKGRALLPDEAEFAINARHRELLAQVADNLRAAAVEKDLLLTSEVLRLARSALDRITGRAGVEDMLDRLFGTFCIGK